MVEISQLIDSGYLGFQENVDLALQVREQEKKYPFLKKINAAWNEQLGWEREAYAYSSLAQALEPLLRTESEGKDPKTVGFDKEKFSRISKVISKLLVDANLNESGSRQQILLILAGLGVLKRQEMVLPEDFISQDKKQSVVPQGLTDIIAMRLKADFGVDLADGKKQTEYEMYRALAELYFSVRGALYYYKNAKEPRSITEDEEKNLESMYTFLYQQIATIYSWIGYNLVDYGLTLEKVKEIESVMKARIATARENQEITKAATEKLIAVAPVAGTEQVTFDKSLNRYLVKSSS
jgi:hypothetical protein